MRIPGAGQAWCRRGPGADGLGQAWPDIVQARPGADRRRPGTAWPGLGKPPEAELDLTCIEPS